MANLTIEMNNLFEFYPEVRDGGVLVYTGPAYEQYYLAMQDGQFWMERNGHELADRNDKRWHAFSIWDGEPEIGKTYDVIIPGVIYDGRGIFRLSNGHTVGGVAQYRNRQ